VGRRTSFVGVVVGWEEQVVRPKSFKNQLLPFPDHSLPPRCLFLQQLSHEDSHDREQKQNFSCISESRMLVPENLPLTLRKITRREGLRTSKDDGERRRVRSLPFRWISQVYCWCTYQAFI